MQIIDLSQTIEPGMPCFPGTPEPAFQTISSIGTAGFSEQLLTFSTHTGTHIDLPSHILADGDSMDNVPIGQFSGKGAAIDVRTVPGGIITTAMLQPALTLIRECDFLLLCSGWSRYWGTSDYFTNYPVLSVETARWLAGFQLKGLGVDMISVDASDSALFPVHVELLQKGTLIIENLSNLFPLLGRAFLFCGFPLKLAHAEASPVRAVAFVE